MTNFQVNIVSDTVCPWCYVGKKRLEKGIAAYKEKHPDSNDTFSTSWFPFYLNPDAGKSMSKKQVYESKFGKERTAMMQERLSEIGKAEGINFKYGGNTGNTRDSHRLVQLGKTKGPQVQTRVIEELFSAYFENEKDITTHEVLTEAGVKAGLDEKEVKDWLESGKGGPEVDREVQQARQQHITGVPNFTINDQYEIGGAQEPAAFVQLFERLKKKEGSL
ncbi:hypothetical protein COCC4DRAFT_82043 [Bipolaris maydis ATCC 48331]|uniref:DSBA-like thioredoxin domain-containing protein n=2 Tax=Cochliobolus heterostrophus TaxID=5016 RepID=M2UEU9_COCH5|nr:uncharacterized protein COCC4DRAFT_82043 [Bipolaris maydis ATCC 48331]EMD97059.1 hypothetical protein COCHEDRAFT_1189981 [Bipolaris maydis C5]KAJ5029525.1 thioredoxin-like protein [Bipolaris maydis]ENI04475.1 hypothetical protein COCC4DRAFT_82043 [Bipolaris maydis ATCC 48331]KAJ5061734.1 thioredoxin-like protein [Bipolaris maydis]KAJ6203338.1 thioredoxin-like protein [Bipolaris maydis]